MSQQCSICGKKPGRGNKKEERGKPKYLGGNGRKTTGITKRQFKLNLQSIRVQDGEEVIRKRVCTSCIRSGKVQKAVVRKPFTVPSH
jgi:large subunit ribosomal protein L28